jgi:hypothetical protein
MGYGTELADELLLYQAHAFCSKSENHSQAKEKNKEFYNIDPLVLHNYSKNCKGKNVDLIIDFTLLIFT